MSLEFDKYAAKGNELINRLAEDLMITRDSAGRIVRSLFHVLRKRIALEESFQLIAQLPMALKGVYVDGWNPNGNIERIHHLKEFLDDIRLEDGPTAGYDFGNDEKAKEAVKAFFRTLSFYVSKGEMEDIAKSLPNEVKKLVISSIGLSKPVL